jgi:hypothetical protein
MWWIRSLQILTSVVGAFLIGVAFRNILRGAASRRWPQAQGRILRSFVLVHKDDDGGEGFVPQVEFEYQVEGMTHRGMRLQYGRIGSGSRRRAERVLAPYPAGVSVRVFFDPRKPADAVLVPGAARGNAVIALAGAVFLACARLIQIHMK